MYGASSTGVAANRRRAPICMVAPRPQDPFEGYAAAMRHMYTATRWITRITYGRDVRGARADGEYHVTCPARTTSRARPTAWSGSARRTASTSPRGRRALRHRMIMDAVTGPPEPEGCLTGVLAHPGDGVGLPAAEAGRPPPRSPPAGPRRSCGCRRRWRCSGRASSSPRRQPPDREAVPCLAAIRLGAGRLTSPRRREPCRRTNRAHEALAQWTILARRELDDVGGARRP